MCRCEERRYLNGDGCFPVDPDVLAERIDRVIPFTGTLSDGYWDQMIRINPTELLSVRTKQKAYLARYGRESFFAWEDRETRELNETFAAISDLIKNENEFSRSQEER